ncbi:MAG: hypothetical protein NC548_34860 [Lachnospiraceae bacterium]|nr:hypothetical protein [Lachnospiraceae bacterium]
MAVARKEYVLSVDKFNTPMEVDGDDAVALLLMRLMLMEPYTNPLHPDMGVGLITYRYTMDNAEALKKRIETQIDTYLPYFTDVSVTLIYCQDHTVNVEIKIQNTVYVYDSSDTPKPITLMDVQNN